MRLNAAALSLFSLLFAATGCGGGGSKSEVFIGTLSYPITPIAVLEQRTVTPRMSGFEDHAAQCRLLSGNVPPGMQMSSNCDISGVPTGTGTYSFSFQLTANGIDKETLGQGSIRVAPPTLEYKYSPKYDTTSTLLKNLLSTSDVVVDTPVINAGRVWPASVIAPVAWKFLATPGTLPPGLQINATTGVISGQPTQEGIYQSSIVATLNSSYGNVVLPIVTYTMEVRPLTLGYSYDGTPGYSRSPLYVGFPHSNTPYISPGSTNGIASTLSDFTTRTVLPTGLVFNAATGVISGTPKALTKIYSFALRYETSVVFDISAIGHQNNSAAPIPVSTRFSENFELAFYYYYGTSVYDYVFAGTVGSVLGIPPVIKSTSVPVNYVLTRQFSTVNSGSCGWDFGLVLDTASGAITGAPNRTGKFVCTVLANVAMNGTSWKQSIPVTFDIK